jgi:preprotein translocase subunit YajC
MLAVLLLAQDAQPQGSPLFTFAPFILIALMFYFMMIRPQQRQEKERQAQIGALKKDDEIVTTGGIIATVVSIKKDKDEVVIESMNARFKVLKSAILRVAKPSDTAEEPVAGADEKEK